MTKLTNAQKLEQYTKVRDHYRATNDPKLEVQERLVERLEASQ